MRKTNSYFGRQLLVIAASSMLISSALWVSACATTPAPTPAPAPVLPGSPVTPPPSGPVTLNLTAVNMAFDKYDLVVHAGEPVTVVFDNKDSVPHNLAVYQDETASKAIFVGEIITGPRTITYEFVAPQEPGTYFFRCDVHPTTMTGALIVQGTTT